MNYEIRYQNFVMQNFKSVTELTVETKLIVQISLSYRNKVESYKNLFCAKLYLILVAPVNYLFILNFLIYYFLF